MREPIGKLAEKEPHDQQMDEPVATPKVREQPLSGPGFRSFRALGCITQCVVANILRRSLREIRDQDPAKLRQRVESASGFFKDVINSWMGDGLE